ncbi:FAD binding domain-containing protein [Paractinoplanes brasiliensis]|uniref:Xanthine dehydrogenase YagS FAD-binding subunit n=1 Tax=Paractinoplanes brasiliensis TaxID=52695 RepID=A0A4R6JAW6_9ACTN|nr:FAD binding domain-containing protein [Actinoplanes brasiliensis]TDO31596.1 xanthine dehydrogenase YagS FAD-binding subunit [Actinoplanes brasiliensis]GID30995.1 oxidoreductase [Actinoplanes brasiliensis]
MKEFEYVRAGSVPEALASDGRFLGGGTNLVHLMRRGVEAPDRLVDVSRLPLSGIRETPDGGLVIGATTTNSVVAADPLVRRRYPALARAILAGAPGPIRDRATVGGNLRQSTRCEYFTDLARPCNQRLPGSGCAAIGGRNRNHAILGWDERCVAVDPSDMAVALSVFDVTVHSLGGPPGLITAVELPPAPPSVFRKARDGGVSVAAVLEVTAGIVRDVRIALGGVAARPWRASAAENLLRHGPATADRFRAAADAELAAARPLRDNAYKVELTRHLIEGVLTRAAEAARARP